MLAQTNLQLYAQRLQSGASAEEMARLRATYDLARQLFVGAYRPSHKPFLCHLVGTASALSSWGESPALIAAGLLHSAYLYGDFGDGARGATDERRRLLIAEAGAEAEAIVLRYTQSRHATKELADEDREYAVLRLADSRDELADAGPRYALGKPTDVGSDQVAERERILAAADRLVGPAAVSDFVDAYRCLDTLLVPVCLETNDRSFHKVPPSTSPIARHPLHRQFLRLTRKFPLRRAG
ncbi:DUF6817 domain-containing protein [Botrimarina hoheduenensis]|uniref:DUF6817 domain-containing protein n=1 Tax=Botrimarina hoheduenensis TaxID=2528000 RepID=UPI0011B79835|nr:hypothetical protein [Botrimarina hoheduenensis]